MPNEPRTRAGWLKAAWDDLSRTIRLEAADEQGICQCVTCGARDRWDSGRMHAGHFVGKPESIKFVETGIHVQCEACNNTGMARTYHQTRSRTETVAHRYYEFMRTTYGLPVIEALKHLKTQQRTHTIDELRVMRAAYKRRQAAARREKGL